MNYYKFVGDKVTYGLTAALAASEEVVIYVEDKPKWVMRPVWKELSNVELLIEINKKTPIFHYLGGNWSLKEL